MLESHHGSSDGTREKWEAERRRSCLRYCFETWREYCGPPDLIDFADSDDSDDDDDDTILYVVEPRRHFNEQRLLQAHTGNNGPITPNDVGRSDSPMSARALPGKLSSSTASEAMAVEESASNASKEAIILRTASGAEIIKHIVPGQTTVQELKEDILLPGDFPLSENHEGIHVKPPKSYIKIIPDGSASILDDHQVLLPVANALSSIDDVRSKATVPSFLLLVSHQGDFSKLFRFLKRCGYISSQGEPDVPDELITDFCCFFYECALQMNFGLWVSTVYWNFTPTVMKHALWKSFPPEILMRVGLMDVQGA